MSIRTSSAKAKGRKFQQYLRDRIYAWFPELEEGDVESRSMGSGGVDLLLSPRARDYVPLSIEAKSTKERPGKGAFEQSKDNAYVNTLPVVLWKPPRVNPSEAILMVRYEDYLEYLRNCRDRKI